MLKRLFIALALVGVGAGAAAVVFGAIILPSHQAVGQINTAVSVGEGLYICQPDGETVDPICPIDTDGVDETIFAANEDLLPGDIAWQIIRVKNVSTEPWDILNMARSWTEVSDPSGTCSLVPEGVVWVDGGSGHFEVRGSNQPGVTILGKVEVGGVWDNPLDATTYNISNDNHSTLEGSREFEMRIAGAFETVHVEPGDYEDLLLGIRLPPSTPNDCLDVVWELTTTWTVQLHPTS